MELSLIKETAQEIFQSSKTVALTGAGISAESGIPTFRGSQSLWSKYDPAEFADVEAFLRNPGKVWQMIKELILIIEAADPNPAHLALAELERRGLLHCVITQNVDNLHQRGGSKKVIEYHGTNERLYCLDCNARYTRKAISLETLPPRCQCGGVVRPDVVFFGEPIPLEARLTAEAEAESCQLMLVVGTSAVVYPAGQLPVMAKSAGAKVIEFNMEETPLTGYISDRLLKGRAAQVLPSIVDEIKKLELGNHDPSW